MFVRSNVRNVCNKKKKGIVAKDGEKIISLVESKLPPEYNWDNFAIEWDVAVFEDSIEVVRAIKSERFLFDTCAQKKFAVINNVEGNWTARQKFVIDSVEQGWLEPHMSWETYGETWQATLNPTTKRIQTRLLNTSYGQREITEEELIPSETSSFSKNEIPVSVVSLDSTVPLTDAIKESLKDKGLLP